MKAIGGILKWYKIFFWPTAFSSKKFGIQEKPYETFLKNDFPLSFCQENIYFHPKTLCREIIFPKSKDFSESSTALLLSPLLLGSLLATVLTL